MGTYVHSIDRSILRTVLSSWAGMNDSLPRYCTYVQYNELPLGLEVRTTSTTGTYHVDGSGGGGRGAGALLPARRGRG